MPMLSKATSPIDMPAWLRQVMQQREVFGVILKHGAGNPAYSEDTVWQGPINPVTGELYNWNAQNYSGNSVISIAANPQRRVLIVENLTATPIAVSFGQTANYSANAAQVVGLVLSTLGSVLYIDRVCPTNSIYVDLNDSAVCIVQGTPA
ncbi:MAG: hypothetical protein ACRD33_00115 [Candidatus Acidiferrales bacterium]